MAVPFSIREYALGMRAKDVAKCWPFDGEPALPPMEVKKSHCLSDDVAITDSNEKPKGPKKRSIADIFAVTPVVEREDIDDDYADDENEDQEGDDDPMVLALFDAKIKKKILRKVEKSRKKMKSSSDICVYGKNSQKAKPAPLIPKKSLCKGSEENPSCAVPMPKKKRLKLKDLASQKKKKPVEASKSTKHRKSDFTVGNNTKSCRKEVSEDQQEKSSDTAKSMGTGEEAFPSLEHAKFQNFIVPPYEIDHIEERGKNLATNEDSDSDVNLQYACDAVCHNEIPKFLKAGISLGRNLSSKLMEGNQVARRNEDSQTYASSSRFPPLRKEGDNRNPNNAEISRSTTMSVTESIDAFPQPPFPFVSTYGETQNRLPFSVQNGKVVNSAHNAQHHQSFPYLSPEELSRNINPFPDMKQRVVTGDVRYTNQDFSCLPLNSLGELIRMNYIGRGKGLPVHDLQTSNRIDFSHFKDNNIIRGGTKADELFTSTPIQSSARDHSKSSMFNGLAGSRNEEGHCFDFFKRNSHVYDLQSTLESIYPAQYGRNQYNQIQYHMEKGKKSDHGPLHMSQHTMRLMGKEFTVGKSNDDSQSSEDGNIWTDKQIIAEHRHHSPATSAIDTSSIENTSLFTNNIQIDQSSHRFLQPRQPLSETIYPRFHPFISRDHSPQLHPYFPSYPSSPFTNQDFPLQDSFVYRYGYDSPHVNRSSNIADLQKQHILSHPTQPAFEFPFLPPVCRDNSKPSSSLAPWLLRAKQNIETPTTSYISYLDVGGSHPSSYPSFPYVPNHISSLSNRQNFVSPASLAPPTPPTSVMNNIHGYRMVPRVNVMDSDKGKATRKRRVNILKQSSRRTKMPDLKVQDFGSNKMARPSADSPELNLTRENINNMDRGVASLGPDKHSISSAATKSDRVSKLQRKLTPIFRF